MKIYLAGPYSHPDPAVREERYRALSRAAADLIAMGHIVYSPISHSHAILACAPEHKLPTSWEYWREADSAFIKWADEVCIVPLPGWRESVGVKAEIDLALQLKKDIVLFSARLRKGLKRCA